MGFEPPWPIADQLAGRLAARALLVPRWRGRVREPASVSRSSRGDLPVHPHRPVHGPGTVRGWDIVIDLPAIFVVFPLLVGSASNSEPGTAFFSSCTLGGDLSYPLYAVHYPIVRAVCFVLSKHAAGVSTRLAVVAGGIALIVGTGGPHSISMTGRSVAF
jgi:hypothetical protein